MTDSFLLPVRRRRRIDAIRSAIALTVVACVLGCTDAPVTVLPEVAVLTSVNFEANGNLDTLHVGDTLVIGVVTLDQNGHPIGYDSLEQRSSNTSVVNFIEIPGGPWDYGDAPGIVAREAGTAVLTATVSAGHRSREGSKLITVVARAAP